MPLLSQEKAIKEFYETIATKDFPELSFEEITEICRTPFIFIKNCFKSGKLPMIMVKHIGKFRVFQSRIKRQMTSEERFFKRGIIDEEEYLDNKKFFEKYLLDLQRLKDRDETEIIDDIEGGETCD